MEWSPPDSRIGTAPPSPYIVWVADRPGVKSTNMSEMPSHRRRPEEERETLGGRMDRMARHAGVGAQFAATLVIMTLGGLWLDKRLGTVPLFLILGMLAGFLGATLALLRQVSPPGGADRDDPGK